MTRKLAYIGFSYLTGLLLASFLSLWLSFAAGSLFLCLGLCIPLVLRPDRKSTLNRLSVCFAACAAGFLLYSGYDYFVCTKISNDSGKEFSGNAVICEADIYSDDSAFYIAECELSCKLKGKVGFYSDNTDLVRGDSISLSGTLNTPDSSGFFDSKSYYRSAGVFLLMKNPVITEINIKENNLFRTLKTFRERVISNIRLYVPSEEGELMIGMLFGSDSWNMPRHTENLMYKAGIGHIAAVSGMHMSIAAGIISAAAAFAPKKQKFLLICLCCTLFGLAADMTISVMRSLIMIIMVYGAELFGRKSDSMSSLGLAVIILTLSSPFTVRSASFMLSVSGVVGTAVLAPYINEAIEEWLNRKSQTDRGRRRINPIVSAFNTSVCASAVIFPVSALVFDEISVISPISNLLVSPLCTAAAGIAMLGAVFSLCPFAFLYSGSFIISGIACKAVLSLAKFLGSLSFAAIPAGLDIIPPLAIVVILSAAAGGLAGGDGLYAALMCIFSVFLSVCAAAVYGAYPVSYSEAAVLTEGNGCIIIICDKDSAQIYDFCGSVRGAKAAYSYIVRTGRKTPAFIFAAVKVNYMQGVYSEFFPESPVISSDEKIGLTYSAENNIIKFGDTCVYPCGEYTVIEKADAKIICINKSCTPPGDRFDLCIYNCTADVSAAADSYICSKDSFSGSIPAGAYYGGMESGEFIIKGGAISPKEEVAWLR